MNTIEDRLRDAFRADAGTVGPESLRGRPDPGAGVPLRRPARRRAPHRLLIPLAAAAAVTAIALTVPVLVPQAGRRATVRQQSTAPAAQQTLPAGVRGALAGSGTAVPPPFFIGTDGVSARVYNAKTGKVVTVIKPPGGMTIEDAAATGNDQAFVVAAVPKSACETFLYRVTLTALGQVASMTPLSVPSVHGKLGSPAALFASADGRMIGFAAATCQATAASAGLLPFGNGNKGWIGVADLAAGNVRTWPVPPSRLDALALSRNGRTLGFSYEQHPGDGTSGGEALRVLPTGAPSGPATQRSRTVRVFPGFQYSIAFGASGTAVLAYAGRTLAAYDVATGRLLGVVHRWPRGQDEGGGFTVAGSGRYLLVYGFSRRLAMRIDLATGHTAWVPTGVSSRDFPNAIAY